MKRKEVLDIAVYERGRRIGTITCEQFRAAVGARSTTFLADLLKRFNEQKKAANEPERVYLELRKPVPVP